MHRYDPHKVAELADINNDGRISEVEKQNFETALHLMSIEEIVPPQRMLFSSTRRARAAIRMASRTRTHGQTEAGAPCAPITF